MHATTAAVAVIEGGEGGGARWIRRRGSQYNGNGIITFLFFFSHAFPGAGRMPKCAGNISTAYGSFCTTSMEHAHADFHGCRFTAIYMQQATRVGFRHKQRLSRIRATHFFKRRTL